MKRLLDRKIFNKVKDLFKVKCNRVNYHNKETFNKVKDHNKEIFSQK